MHRKQQFAIVFHFLEQGKPMLEYEAIQPFFTFLGVPKMPKKHCKDTSGWTIAEFLHQQVTNKARGCMHKDKGYRINAQTFTWFLV